LVARYGRFEKHFGCGEEGCPFRYRLVFKLESNSLKFYFKNSHIGHKDIINREINIEDEIEYEFENSYNIIR
jgi:hypothetical protein